MHWWGAFHIPTTVEMITERGRVPMRPIPCSLHPLMDAPSRRHWARKVGLLAVPTPQTVQLRPGRKYNLPNSPTKLAGLLEHDAQAQLSAGPSVER